ncbi:MAG: sugar kinase [Spirochaetia bacterium]|nr:sugar kinase [Spirochaetia bacterium]
MGEIVTFGEIMGRIEMENNYRFNQALPGKVRITYAGAEANVASSLSHMGRATQYVTSLPDNPISKSCVAYLHSLNVGTDHLQFTPFGRFGLYFLETGANQRPSNIIYDRDYSSISEQDPNSYNWDIIFSQAKWFHISGITPALSKNAAVAAIESVKAAKKHEVKVSCDLNFRKKLWNWDKNLSRKELARETMREILLNVDILIGNEEDASDVLDIHPKNVDVNLGKLDFSAYHEVAKKVSEQFHNIQLVAFTLRESISASHNNWGAMIYDTASDFHYVSPTTSGYYAPYEIRNIIDRVGGGDSFSAGLIYALTDKTFNNDLQQVLDYATAASCLCHSIHGDINYSTPEEIKRLMQGNASGRVVR